MVYEQYTTIISEALNITPDVALIVLSFVGIWSLVWKGLALWKSAVQKQKVWFIALLIINTAGILEILYIFIFSKLGRKKSSSKIKKQKKKK